METTERADKPATAARIYDYHLGGTHNFPADRAAGDQVAKLFPLVPVVARTNRAFLRRAVRHVTNAGIRQFLDVGSGIPTEGNVHEIAQDIAPEARVVYVDIDPVAVSESLEILEGNAVASAIRGNLTDVAAILAHPEVTRLIDFSRPVAVLLGAVLHFVPDDAEALASVRQLRDATVPGSYLVISHATPDESSTRPKEMLDKAVEATQDVYKQRTATPFRLRSRGELAEFFNGYELVEPGVVWLPQWRPEPEDPKEFAAKPEMSVGLGGVGVRR